MKPRVVALVSAASVSLLAVGYAAWGGAPGWLHAVEASVAAAAGVNHPVMFAAAKETERAFNIFAIAGGLALRVFLFASVTAWVLRRRLDSQNDVRPPVERGVRRVRPAARVSRGWLEVSRN